MTACLREVLINEIRHLNREELDDLADFLESQRILRQMTVPPKPPIHNGTEWVEQQ